MIAFELTMPNRGSWNNRWSQEHLHHYIIKRNSDVPKDIVGKSYVYNWSDGWTAEITISKVDCRMAASMKKLSAGFCGYDWMVNSLIKYGEIMTEREIREKRGY